MRVIGGLLCLMVCSQALAAPAILTSGNPAAVNPEIPKVEQPVQAGQTTTPRPLRLDLSGRAHLPLRLYADGEPYPSGTFRDYEAPPPVATRFGPFSVRSGKGSDGRDHIANYTLDGVNILGGDVSGTVDGRDAKIFLRWHPGE